MVGRFFYWNAGGEVQGPVSKADLQQLLQQQAVGPATQLCREGETEWFQLDPANFAASEPPPYLPAAAMPNPVSQDSLKVKERPEDGTLHFLLKLVCYVITFGGATLTTWIQYNDSAGIDPVALVGRATGGFIGGLLIIGLFPYLLSLMLPQRFRLWARFIGMTVMLVLLLLGLFINAHPEIQIVNDLKAVDEDFGHLAEKEEKAQQVMPKIDPKTLTSHDDLLACEASAANLKQARANTLDYIQHFDDHCHEALTKDRFSAALTAEAIQSYRQAMHIDFLLEKSQRKLQLSDDISSFLDLLDKNWGHWSVDKETQKVMWDNQDLLQKYNDLLSAILKEENDIRLMPNPFKKTAPSAPPSN